MKKVNALLLGLAVLLAVGCGGDDDIETAKSCNLTRINFGNSSGIYRELIYNGNGQLTESRYNNGTDYNLYTYNAANEIAKQEVYASQGLSMTTHYFYAGGLLKKLINISAFSDTLSIHFFNHDTSQRITTVESTFSNSPDKGIDSLEYPNTNTVKIKKYSLHAASGQANLRKTSEYRFDNYKNLYGKFYYLFINPYLDGDILPEAHNVIWASHTTFYNGPQVQTQTTTYQYNSEGYPISWNSTTSSGSSEGTYTYDCQ